MKRPGYKEAIQWITDNDDTEWLKEEDPIRFMSVTACLIVDLFDVDSEKVLLDLYRAKSRRDFRADLKNRPENQ